MYQTLYIIRIVMIECIDMFTLILMKLLALTIKSISMSSQFIGIGYG